MKHLLLSLAVLGFAQPALAQSEGEESHQLRAQIEHVRQAAARYRDSSGALDEGWRPAGREVPLRGVLWRQAEGLLVHEDELDFGRPSYLIYARIDGEDELVGVGYVAPPNANGLPPEGFAGASDLWRPLRGAGPNTERLFVALVWLYANPDGVFAPQHRALPYLQLGLPARYASASNISAALGLHLATEDGCEEAIRARTLRAELSIRQLWRIRGACTTARNQVQRALSMDAASLNRVAETAWRNFTGIVDAALLRPPRAQAAETADGEIDFHE